MALSEDRVKGYIRRLLLARMRILCNHGFYGLLLMHMTYSLDESLETAATDGQRIIFSPQFLDDLSDSELDFVMMHEVMHVVLQHCFRGAGRNGELFNIACDIVVNSNILSENNSDIKAITLKKYGEAMHVAPDGKEGCVYTAEQVYEMLLRKKGFSMKGGGSKSGDKGNLKSGGSGNSKSGKQSGGTTQGDNSVEGWDDHSRWGTSPEEEVLKDAWVKRLVDAAEAISIRDPSNQRGLLPAFAKRILKELKNPQTDWRTILNEFVQEEVTDYSFSPPDHRFSESPFFLPDFNDTEYSVADILFMIDTSGSMSDEMITAAYSEVKGAIDQFGGKLKGWLGFFDAGIIEPQPFEGEEEFSIIKPVGGGGTSFSIIFEYVRKFMQDKPPVSIIILTDGYAPFPRESSAGGIPVLWLINNEVVTPPWGKVARITV
ncbi:MAG: VWA-like domain-containing protein [Candidatus Coproplasma sp.]